VTLRVFDPLTDMFVWVAGQRIISFASGYPLCPIVPLDWTTTNADICVYFHGRQTAADHWVHHRSGG